MRLLNLILKAFVIRPAVPIYSHYLVGGIHTVVKCVFIGWQGKYQWSRWKAISQRKCKKWGNYFFYQLFDIR